MRSSSDVVVTGIGVVSPLGLTLSDTWRSLLDGRSALRRWPDLEREGFRVPIAARVAFDASVEDRKRGRGFALRAARAAMADADLKPSDLGGTRRFGIYVGTTMGESAAYEQAAAGAELDLLDASGEAFARHLRHELGGSGPTRAYGTACAAGNYAIGSALEDLQWGEVDVALAGASEPLSRIALLGFSRVRAMSPTLCRPFDHARSGMQLGEGAAFLVLERRATAEPRGTRPWARIGALGLSCDAGHPTAPRADGAGMAAAMLDAVEQAGIEPGDVGWICAHGSGTKASDAAEARAIRHVFGHRPPPVTGVKGSFGHCMGAATAIEAAVTALAFRHRLLPPTANLERADPECRLDVVAEPRRAEGLAWALSCGFAFGGINSALLLGAA